MSSRHDKYKTFDEAVKSDKLASKRHRERVKAISLLEDHKDKLIFALLMTEQDRRNLVPLDKKKTGGK